MRRRLMPYLMSPSVPSWVPIWAPCLVLAALMPGAARSADRAIQLTPLMAMSWEFVTPGTGSRARPTLGVGFWQRGSGAKPGVGSVYVATMEYQLPETLPARVRSATFQFSGRQSQCSGAEPVVIDIYAYPADGKEDVADASAGARVAQMRADCTTNPAFDQPIDVTALVRQLSVPSGIRHIGFSMRKANNRQGPGIFSLAAGKLTIVVADQDIAQRSQPPAAQATAVAGVGQAPGGGPTNAGPNGLIKALGTLARGGANKGATREQAKGEALDGLANLPPAPAGGSVGPAGPAPAQAPQ